jgi:hypothetical protein
MDEIELDLGSFLPAYVGINAVKGDPFFSFYSDRMPAGYTHELVPTTYLKREFNDLKLPAVEPLRPEGAPFEPMKSQTFVSRFLSRMTPYNRLLIYHAVGTGKTCLFSLLSELLQDQDPNMWQTLVLTRSEVLAENAKQQIIETCTGGKYVPSRWDAKTKSMISDEAFLRRQNKAISERYIFDTWERISKKLAVEDDKFIEDTYSNRLIVIDEAHGIRIQPKESEVNIYKQIDRLVHTVKNSVVIFLTATPMRDRVKEAPALLNLLLPRDAAFDVENFDSIYFNGSEFKPEKKAEFKAKLRGLISHVREVNSNVRKIYEGAPIRKYLGGKGMEKIPLVTAPMSSIQSKAYMSAYKMDRKTGAVVEKIDEADELGEESSSRTGLYKNSRQASLFVAPDGTYGTDLEKKWVKISAEEQERRDRQARLSKMTEEEKEAERKKQLKEKRQARLTKEKISDKNVPLKSTLSRGTEGNKVPPKKSSEKKEKAPSRPLKERLPHATEALREAIYGGKDDPGTETKLRNLEKFSSEYAGVMRQLLYHPTEKAFVYCNLVEGSGCNLFAVLLQLFGLEHADIPTSLGKVDLEKIRPPPNSPRRFILVTSKFPTLRQASYLINKVYNHPKNKYGDFIQVIIASRIVSEGINFKATRQFHNTTPGWNETETLQAMGRILRAFAHDIFTDPEERFVKIFRWCSMPSDSDFPSIFFEMYRLSENKDYPIKQVERLFKEAAVDCALNVARNMRPDIDKDDSRDCDYQSCIYQCDDIPAAWYALGGSGPNQPLIDDTYNLFYAKEQIEGIKTEIRELFHSRFMYDFFELRSHFPEVSPLILLRALKEIIDSSMPILNRYGITSYLRENQNLYFLIDNPQIRHTQNLYMLSEYTSSPTIRENIPFSDWARFFEFQYLPEKLDRLDDLARGSVSDLSSSIELTLRSLDSRSQETILEATVRAQEAGNKEKDKLRQAIRKIYDQSLISQDELLISSLLNDEYDILRCYDAKENAWQNCPANMNDIYESAVSKKRAKLKSNPFGYYAVYDSERDKFKIATVRNAKIAASTGAPDKRYERPGREGLECGTGKLSARRVMLFMLEMGDIADEQSPPLPAPDIQAFLSPNELAIMNSKPSPATPSAVYSLWLNELHKSESVNPKAFNIDEAEQEKEELESTPKLDKSGQKRLKNIIKSIENENRTRSEMENRIRGFSGEKLKRWYSILAFGRIAKKTLCPALREWFTSLGLLEYR